MLPIRRILVPVNFTESCRAAARFAIDLASSCNADVWLLHVLEPWGSAVGFESAAMLEESLEAQRQKASIELQHFGDFEPSDKLRRMVLDGDPATQIVRFAHNEAADVILMPTRGYGVFRRLLLGSVTAKVLHDAECPVWTGVHPEVFNADGVVAVHKVACAVDLGPQTSTAIQWANAFARHFHAEMVVVHALAPITDKEWSDRLCNMAREQLIAHIAQLGVETELHLESGEVPGAIPRIAKSVGADVLVIGRGHASAGPRLGGHAYAIVRDSPCPVVSV